MNHWNSFYHKSQISKPIKTLSPFNKEKSSNPDSVFLIWRPISIFNGAITLPYNFVIICLYLESNVDITFHHK